MKPRKTFDLKQSILKAGKDSRVTQTVRDEFLESTGIDLALIVDVTPDLPITAPKDAKNCVLACITYEPGEELALPDNLTGICAWGCGRTIQYRPNHPEWLTKVCLHCIDERPRELS